MKLDILYNMVKGMAKVLPFYIFTFLPLNAAAQNFTQRIQTVTEGEGQLVIHHDDMIDLLVNGTLTDTPKQTEKVDSKSKTQPQKPQQPTKPTIKPREEATNNAQETDSLNTVTYKRYKTTGYRVQVFRGGDARNDRQQAESAGSRIRDAFPDEEVYVEFFAPDWTCRVGNYRELEDARNMRDQLKKMGFDTATIVKGKIIISIPQQ